MRKDILILLVCLFFSCVFNIYSQNVGQSTFTSDKSLEGQSVTIPQGILTMIQDDVLRMLIKARVLNSMDIIIWDVDIDKLTIPGRGINLRLNGDNIIVDVEFIPFRQRNNTIMLVVKGDAWVENKSNKRLKYQISMKSIPISTGDPVVFYPLGVNSRNARVMNLELEITLFPYSLANSFTNNDESIQP